MVLSDDGGGAPLSKFDLRMYFDADVMPGVFEVLEFRGTEEIFESFRFEIDLVSDRDDLDLSALLDTSAALTITKVDATPRSVNGIIVEIERRASGFSRTFYRVVLSAAISRLQYISDSRIFQQQTVPEIAGQLFLAGGVTDIEWRLEGSHAPREYCVCYQETLYDFLRRILSEEGIFFWFEHSRKGHKLILSDAPLSMPYFGRSPFIPYNATPGGASRKTCVSRFAQTERLRATNREARDYVFQRPDASNDLQASQYMPNGAKGRYELFQYPGGYEDLGVGRMINQNALEAHRVDATTAVGETNCIELSAGFIFGLTNHPNAAANTNHRLLKVEHQGRQLSALQEDAPDDAATTYQANFTCQPAHLPYRAADPSPRPRIDEPQIAHVTGPAGETIYCDEFGRVKVWFPWDRHGTPGESSSCWVRVMQYAAGRNMGSLAVPRVGDEVIVIFLEGDPDRPIIAGCTYNGTNNTPYGLPGHKTKTVIRSNLVGEDPGAASAGGQSDGDKRAALWKFNEFSFENQKEDPVILLYAAGRKLEIINKGVETVQATDVSNIDALYQSYLATVIIAAFFAPMTMCAAVASSVKTSACTELVKDRR